MGKDRRSGNRGEVVGSEVGGLIGQLQSLSVAALQANVKELDDKLAALKSEYKDASGKIKDEKNSLRALLRLKGVKAPRKKKKPAGPSLPGMMAEGDSVPVADDAVASGAGAEMASSER